MRVHVVGAALFASVALLLSSPVAFAQDRSSASFFSDGQRLMAQGKYAEACPNFEKALALNPGAGTKFNLAECYEKTGRPATALTLFREVENVTRQVGQQERSALAKERADALEPRVPTIVVRAPWLSTVPNASLTLDGRPITLNDVEKPVRVDMGKHVAIASVDPQHETREEVIIEREGESRVLALSAPVALAEKADRNVGTAAGPAVPASTTAPDSNGQSSGSTQRTIGIALAGTGVVALGVGTVIALVAKSTYDDATETCGTACPAANAADANDARTTANVGGAVMGAGLAIAAAGAILWFTAPSAKSTNGAATRPAHGARLVPSATPAGLGLSAMGTF